MAREKLDPRQKQIKELRERERDLASRVRIGDRLIRAGTVLVQKGGELVGVREKRYKLERDSWDDRHATPIVERVLSMADEGDFEGIAKLGERLRVGERAIKTAEKIAARIDNGPSRKEYLRTSRSDYQNMVFSIGQEPSSQGTVVESAPSGESNGRSGSVAHRETAAGVVDRWAGTPLPRELAGVIGSKQLDAKEAARRIRAVSPVTNRYIGELVAGVFELVKGKSFSLPEIEDLSEIEQSELKRSIQYITENEELGKERSRRFSAQEAIALVALSIHKKSLRGREKGVLIIVSDAFGEIMQRQNPPKPGRNEEREKQIKERKLEALREYDPEIETTLRGYIDEYKSKRELNERVVSPGQVAKALKGLTEETLREWIENSGNFAKVTHDNGEWGIGVVNYAVLKYLNANERGQNMWYTIKKDVIVAAREENRKDKERRRKQPRKK